MLSTFYLHYFLLLTRTLETYNNIDPKTKALFKVDENIYNFESRNENIAFLRKD